MHVTIDEAGQHQVAADIEDRHAVREGRFGILTKAGDMPTGDPDIDEMPVGEAAVGQKGVEVHAIFLAGFGWLSSRALGAPHVLDHGLDRADYLGIHPRNELAARGQPQPPERV